MATSTPRRPLPALAFLLALSLLTALVWWRVLHRSDSAKATSLRPRCSASRRPAAHRRSGAAAVTVTVLNSTQKTGLAAQVTGFLAADGFKTGTRGQRPDRSRPGHRRRRDPLRPGRSGGGQAAVLLRPRRTLVLDTRTDASVDLAVGAKYTAVAQPADVAKALAAAKVSQLPRSTAARAPPARAARRSRRPPRRRSATSTKLERSRVSASAVAPRPAPAEPARRSSSVEHAVGAELGQQAEQLRAEAATGDGAEPVAGRPAAQP